MAETIAVIGGGGREAALVDAYAQSDHVERILAFPGNDLMRINTDKPVQLFPELKTTSVPQIVEQCQKAGVTLVDVAQDNAVEAGLVDALQKAGIPAVGPTREAGKIEWDKAWAREFDHRHSIPQPSFQICTSPEEGFRFLESQPDQPWFVKAAYLAEGKGALPASNNEEAIRRVEEMKRFGDAGKVFLIEKWLRGDEPGEEFSTYIFSDGQRYKVIGSAQDHKRANDYDEGENTGGMGCSTPPLVMTPKLLQAVQRDILSRTIIGMQTEGRPYKGVLYLGGMAIKTGDQINPYVIEFNARWGDPEAQVIVPGLVNDLFEVGMAIALGDISQLNIQTDGKARVVVAGASRGYPGDYSEVKGKRIYGIDDARKVDGVRLYGAGVKNVDGKYFASGGRLFYVVGEGNTVIDARQRAYEAMSIISIEENNLHFRTDIGWRDVASLRANQE